MVSRGTGRLSSRSPDRISRTSIADDPDGADIALIGVPFDGGVTHRSGARHGPRAVREQSTLLRRLNSATGVAPFANARVRDLGDCWLEFPYELTTALEEIAWAAHAPTKGEANEAWRSLLGPGFEGA